MVKSMCVESDDLSALVDWLNTRPEEDSQVWIGGVEPESNIYMAIIGSDYPLAQWIFDKIAVGGL